MKNTSKIVLIISLLWSITTTICCVLVIAISTWTMMHIDSYHTIAGWVIWQMVLSVLILPALFIFLRKKLYPQRQRFYLITKRIQIIVAIVYLLTMFFEVNRYEHFIKFNSFGPYKSPSGKQIVPTTAFVDNGPNGRKVFFVIYQTELNVSDTLALRQEILYVWRQIIVDADKQHANYATISASAAAKDENNLSPKGITVISAKDSSGSWKVLR